MDKQALEQLLQQKADIEHLIAETAGNQIAFSVDAGIISRLGKELVGRSETAVSELVKNAYDADANNVEINFINSDAKGGSLIIKDDGHGMTTNDLVKGFMRLSSSDKVHHPVSPKYKRIRAGRKGIGRFATQRLGGKLVIKTYKQGEDKGIKLEIDWANYTVDKNLEEIYNPICDWDATFNHGTIIEIHDLYESWTEAQIKRVYRYITELLQPDFLSDRSKEIEINGGKFKIATQDEGSFSVSCSESIGEKKKSIINEDSLIFDRAVAVIEGYVDGDMDGYCTVTSSRFSILEEVIPIGSGKKSKDKYDKWKEIHDVYFKAYYFIYNRPNYYQSMTKMELQKIQDLSNKLGSIRLYRNGFRVLPYGEPYDDWLKLDSKNRNRSGVNAPLGNNNFFGFVEVIDKDGKLFEETASREGLIENKALEELRDFIYRCLSKGRDLVSEAIKLERDSLFRPTAVIEKSTENLFDELEKLIESSDSYEHESKEKQEYKATVKEKVRQIRLDFKRVLEEVATLRVWAGLGLSIGEFTHDVIQFSSALGGYITSLDEQNLDEHGREILDLMEEVFLSFRSYISFFDTGMSIREGRRTQPINMIDICHKFVEIIEGSNDKNIEILPLDVYDGYDLISLPMHPTEWYSILFNLYSNSKKAILRSGKQGKIMLILGKVDDNIYLEFLDNGDGVPEKNRDRIFNAFFSTSTLSGANATESEDLTGKGLGLKLVKDTLEVYGGSINLIDSPDVSFVTCFRIEIPAATEQQLIEYGY